MQIGEFAALCKTKISVLRHYDRVGLLRPDYIDEFTGYRYYRGEQAETFFKISALKEAGFSLSEISSIISGDGGSYEPFAKKKEELYSVLSKLDKAQALICKVSEYEKGIIETDKDGLLAHLCCPSPHKFEEKANALEDWLARDGYQRISPISFQTKNSKGYSLSCRVLKLSDKISSLCESCDLPFEDDPEVVGKWQVVGEFAVREDFFTAGQSKKRQKGRSIDVIYFLPKGECYWCYRWTKGKLIIEKGEELRSANSYTVEKVGTQRYMFVEHKSYNYKRGGAPTVLVLRQLDNISYSVDDIKKTDETDLPFADDRAVIGEWIAVGFVWDKDEFDPSKECKLPLIYRRISFFEGGEIESEFENNNIVRSRKSHEWTKGYVLRKWTKSACAYEIRKIDGRDYLFLEWKSGDFIYGGMETNYYVFERIV